MPHNPNDDNSRSHREAELDETRPTPGSAEGERDASEQSASNAPRAASTNNQQPGDVPVAATGDR
jgi:hypothetical protein